MTLCFEGVPPETLVPSAAAARGAVTHAFLVGNGEKRPLAIDDGRVELSEAKAGDCALYEVDLEAAARALGARGARRHEAAIAIDPRAWLLRPTPIPPKLDATLVLELPPGHDVSAPWPRLSARDSRAFRLPASSFTRRGRVVLGRFARIDVALPGGGTLEAALLGEIRAGRAGVERWLSEAGRAVSTLYGVFPRQRVQVTVTPAPGDRVHFGLVLRGGGPGVHLLVGERATEDDLVGEWIAVHELSHLALPVVRAGDPWLSEGVATYYQYVLRARAGLMDEREAWQKLHEGFERGRADLRGQTLAEAARGMHESRAYQRVYWTGTALALLADVELRRRARDGEGTGQGIASLDEALRRLHGCCLDDDRAVSAVELCDHLDALVGHDVLGPLVRAHLGSREMPELDDVYRQLGLRVEGGEVSLDDDAPLAYLRREIMTASWGKR